MHDDEVDIDQRLVRRLVDGQFPRWAGLALERVASAGTDNALYRLGADLVVRLPRIGWAVDDVAKEQRWLPRLAPGLPAAIPEPLGQGEPAHGYPWSWSVYRWLDGANPVVGGLADPAGLASDLARFVRALHRVDPAAGPRSHRSGPLHGQEESTRAALAALAVPAVLAGLEESLPGTVDLDAVTQVWEAALEVPAWSGPPVWVHGDLSPGNLLLAGGRLSAVIDFGAVGVGDPACDQIVAWNLLPASAREVFRTELGVDDAMWERGRGWALSIALVALPYYHRTNPVLADSARHVIAEVLADAGRSPARR